jgi:hypothetical protein
VALGPPDVLSALAPASAEVVVVLAVEPPIAADAKIAEALLPVASEVGAWNRDPFWGATASSPRAASVAPVLDQWGFGSSLRPRR